MLKSIVIIIFGLIAGVLILAATKPDVFRVERRASIDAPPDAVFTQLNDFKRWGAWSPWEKKDPSMKRSFGAATSGKGATYAWEGNSEVGQGSMQIVDSAAPSRVALKLDFLKPFEAHNDVEFTLVPNGASTEVTWTMQGPTPYFAKILHVFVDMDRMVGQDFESGLANLKAMLEQTREKPGGAK